MEPFYKVALKIVRFVANLLFRIKVKGIENIPDDKGFIMAANHTSMTDPVFIGINCKRQIYFMGKAELFKFPPLAWLFTKLGVFAVNRGKGDMTAINNAENLLEEGKILGIFPEGTRYLTGAPRKAKSGIAYIVMDTKSDILPVSIYRDGKLKIFGKTTVRYGKPISYESLVQDDLTDRANIRNITTRVTEEITTLWEMKH